MTAYSTTLLADGKTGKECRHETPA
jgi:hypothetical protein